jgi:hypothetical protein
VAAGTCECVRTCLGEGRGACVSIVGCSVLRVNHLVTKVITSNTSPPPQLSYKSKYLIQEPFLLANGAARVFFFGGGGGTRNKNYKIS